MDLITFQIPRHKVPKPRLSPSESKFWSEVVDGGLKLALVQRMKETK